MGMPIPDDINLQGPFRPMRFEATVEDCIVSYGEIPKDLCGGFYKVGPTWRRPSPQGATSLMTMDGMIQGLTFESGRADYRNRWIRTPKFVQEEKLGRGIFSWSDTGWGDWRDFGYGDVIRDQYTKGISQATNIVNAFPFGGDVLTSGEQGGPPIAVDPHSLETKGIVPWSSELSPGCAAPASAQDMTFTAHPKWDPDTGDLYGWTWRDTPPYVTLHWVHPDGRVETRELHEAPYESLAHDIWLTPNWVVMPFQPFIVSQARVAQDKGMLDWDESLPIMVAFIPRGDIHGEVTWIHAEIEPQYVMHTMGANEMPDGTIQLDAPIFNRPPFRFEDEFTAGEISTQSWTARSTLGRWTANLTEKTITTEKLSDRPAELPKMDERHYGKAYRFGFAIGGEPRGEKAMSMRSLVAWDSTTGNELGAFNLKCDRPVMVTEGTFAPRARDAAEGDGYIIVPVSYWAHNQGEYVIFDTDDISAGPICRIELPFMLGWTAHGHWMSFT
jgi:carotenoid cleavage dioxygenase-like enzyme